MCCKYDHLAPVAVVNAANLVLSIHNLIVLHYKLYNSLTAGDDDTWHVHSVTPADENRLCPMSIHVFRQKLRKEQNRH